MKIYEQVIFLMNEGKLDFLNDGEVVEFAYDVMVVDLGDGAAEDFLNYAVSWDF